MPGGTRWGSCLKAPCLQCQEVGSLCPHTYLLAGDRHVPIGKGFTMPFRVALPTERISRNLCTWSKLMWQQQVPTGPSHQVCTCLVSITHHNDDCAAANSFAICILVEKVTPVCRKSHMMTSAAMSDDGEATVTQWLLSSLSTYLLTTAKTMIGTKQSGLQTALCL